MSTFKNILVPLDFGPQSDLSIQAAKQMATESDAKITLLNVLEGPKVNNDGLQPNFMTEFYNDLEKHAEEQMRAIIQKHGLHGSESFIRVGVAKVAITDFQKEHHNDLVIMGTKGVDSVEEFFLGSTTEFVVRLSTCPVLSIDNKCDFNSFSRILVLNDFEEDLGEKFTKIKRFGDDNQSEFHLVHVNTPSSFVDTLSFQVNAKKFADKWGIKDPVINQFNHRRFENGVLNAVKHYKADLVIMPTHGRTGLERTLRGSVTENIVNSFSIPILTYKIRS